MEHLSPTNEYERRLQPKIYVASLSDYNNGTLHGAWIDATDDPEDMHAAIAEMLKRSPEPGAEEFAIHDFSDFSSFSVGEYEDIATVHKIACGIAEHGDAFTAYIELVGTENATDTGFTDAYCGTYPSLRAFVDQFVEDMGWDSQLDQLRERSGLGMFLDIDYDELETAIRIEWNIIDGTSGVHIFAP